LTARTTETSGGEADKEADDSLSPVEEPSFDLVVTTVDRTEELGRLLDSLERQTHRAFRVVLVDQNEDERLADLISARDTVDIVRVRSPRGLSRGRNIALERLSGDVVAFPDDDCVYADDLLERVALLLARPDLDGVLGRTADSAGRSSTNWADERQRVDRDNVWHCANSNSVFLRRELVQRVGTFDESLGLGSSTPWSSGEETEYLVRAVELGGRLEYDPALVVLHSDVPSTPARGYRDGASVGYILGKHRYRFGALVKMLVRPAGGTALSLVRLDLGGARFHTATLRGRFAGYRAGLRARRAGA
jgi:glycosyltransferase involved in cell wall biosynthesis